MAIFIFCIIVLIIFFIDYHNNKQIISPFSIIAFPYLFIILINNTYAVNYGFYLISDSVIFMVLAALILFYLGVCVSNFFFPTNIRVKSNDVNSILELYRIEMAVKYVFICEIIIGIRAVVIVRNYGVLYLVNNEGLMLTGILGHLLLTIVPLIPLLLLYWLKNKRKTKYLIAAVVGASLLFLTFIKYHVIGLIIIIYLFVSFADKKYEKSGAVILVGVSASLFVLNYIISFVSSGVIGLVDKGFYFNHFWKYVSGGLIYDNRIFTGGVYEDSVLHRIGAVFFALPNMFINRFLGTTFFEAQRIPAVLIANNGEVTNVIDAIGYFFPSNGDLVETILWCLVMILNGIITSRLYWRAKNSINRLPFSFSIYGSYFVFLSFFACFAKLETPWEMLVWGMLIPIIFDKRFSYKNGKIQFNKNIDKK